MTRFVDSISDLKKPWGSDLVTKKRWEKGWVIWEILIPCWESTGAMWASLSRSNVWNFHTPRRRVPIKCQGYPNNCLICQQVHTMNLYLYCISHKTDFSVVHGQIFLWNFGIVLWRSKRIFISIGARWLKGSKTKGKITILSSRSLLTKYFPHIAADGSFFWWGKKQKWKLPSTGRTTKLSIFTRLEMGQWCLLLCNLVSKGGVLTIDVSIVVTSNYEWEYVSLWCCFVGCKCQQLSSLDLGAHLWGWQAQAVCLHVQCQRCL